MKSTGLLQVVATALLCLVLPATGITQSTGKPGVILEEFIYDSAPFPSVHAATIVELADGRLVGAFFGGSREGDTDVEIWVSIKNPEGRWSPPVSVADGEKSDGSRVATWNPVLFQPEGGDLQLFYKVAAHGERPWTGMVMSSGDGGQTWGDARELATGFIGPVKNKPIQLADGSILAPSSTEDHGWRVHVERSVDGGESWQMVGPLNPEARIGAIQPTLLTYANGSIQMLCRTRSEHGFMAESWSKDGGESWTPLAPGPLPNNNSGFDGVTLADGRQLLVYNHSTRTEKGTGHKGRGILNVAVSEDGVNWHAALVLDHIDEPNRQFSYPSVIQARDGLVHIVYTWHRERIKHVVLDPKALVLTPIKDGKWPAGLNK